MKAEEILSELRNAALDMRKGVHTPAHIATIMKAISYIKSLEEETVK